MNRIAWLLIAAMVWMWNTRVHLLRPALIWAVFCRHYSVLNSVSSELSKIVPWRLSHPLPHTPSHNFCITIVTPHVRLDSGGSRYSAQMTFFMLPLGNIVLDRIIVAVLEYCKRLLNFIFIWKVFYLEHNKKKLWGSHFHLMYVYSSTSISCCRMHCIYEGGRRICSRIVFLRWRHVELEVMLRRQNTNTRKIIESASGPSSSRFMLMIHAHETNM